MSREPLTVLLERASDVELVRRILARPDPSPRARAAAAELLDRTRRDLLEAADALVTATEDARP